MRQRCFNPKASHYENYGGRGITVCERWQSFENFLADMGPKPFLRAAIDRIDNDGDYEPGNCRWATQREQGCNTRSTVLTADMVRELRAVRAAGGSISGWARAHGIGKSTALLAANGHTWADIV